MKRELILLAVIAVLITALTAPLTGGLTALAETTPTTTMPLTTTTTGWDCISTTPPPLTTTSTTWVLTGPDGINPDYTTTVTTTTAPALCGDTKDLLSDAAITVSDTMAILGHPSGGNWLSVDCYSYDGGTIEIVPTGYSTINGLHPYLHTTIIANVPFKLTMTEAMGIHNAVDWVGEANVNEDGTIKAGAYVLSARVDSMFEYCNYVDKVTVTLTAPGSVTVGHLALSNEEVCGESAPRIQTTTRPSFPSDDTTTVTTTTNPTVGDVLLPGDADGDGLLTSSDARVILMHCLLGTGLGENGAILADYNGDGAVTTYDTRMILISLLA